MLGVSDGEKDLEGTLGGHLRQSSQVAGVINFFGPSDLTTMNDFPSTIDHNAPDSPESRLIGGALPGNQDKARHASPVTYVSKGDTPIIHFHGTKDLLVPFDQSVQFDKKLKASSIASVLITVEEGGHGFGGHEIDHTVCAWFEKYLLGKNVQMKDKTIILPRKKK